MIYSEKEAGFIWIVKGLKRYVLYKPLLFCFLLSHKGLRTHLFHFQTPIIPLLGSFPPTSLLKLIHTLTLKSILIK